MTPPPSNEVARSAVGPLSPCPQAVVRMQLSRIEDQVGFEPTHTG